MSDPIDSNAMIRIQKYGAYYNPAWKHYGVETNVMCDRCFVTNLKTCIGYGEHDLCLNCAADIVTIKPKQPTIKMQQTQFTGGNVPRRMRQNQYRK